MQNLSRAPRKSSFSGVERGARRNSLLSRSFDPNTLIDDDDDEVETPPSTPVKPRRRRSSAASFSMCSPSPTLPGSFITSLLSGRFPPTSPPSQFTLLLGVLGCPPRCPSSLLAPSQLRIPFVANWYDLKGPYSGTVDVLEYFNDLHDSPNGSRGASPSQIRYGYRIPPKGQLQLIISNQLGTVIKLFLVPYDLLDMKAGEQTFFRQVWNTHPVGPEAVQANASSDENNESGRGTPPETKESLRYAVQMHFVSPPPKHHHRTSSKQTSKRMAGGSLPKDSDDNLSPFPMTMMDMASSVSSLSSPLDLFRHESVPNAPSSTPPNLLPTSDPKIYLSKSIRLVFSSQPPEEDEKMTSVVEEFGMVGYGSAPGDRGRRFFPYSGA